MVTNYNIIASKLIWRFFSRFDIDGAIRGYNKSAYDFEGDQKNTITSDFGAFQIFHSPATDFITVSGNITKNIPYTLTSIQGKIVLKGAITPNDRRIDTQALWNGVYILKNENHIVKIVKEY